MARHRTNWRRDRETPSSLGAEGEGHKVEPSQPARTAEMAEQQFP